MLRGFSWRGFLQVAALVPVAFLVCIFACSSSLRPRCTAFEGKSCRCQIWDDGELALQGSPVNSCDRTSGKEPWVCCTYPGYPDEKGKDCTCGPKPSYVKIGNCVSGQVEVQSCSSAVGSSGGSSGGSSSSGKRSCKSFGNCSDTPHGGHDADGDVIKECNDGQWIVTVDCGSLTRSNGGACKAYCGCGCPSVYCGFGGSDKCGGDFSYKTCGSKGQDTSRAGYYCLQ
jgi:hypothetical protein